MKQKLKNQLNKLFKKKSSKPAKKRAVAPPVQLTVKEFLENPEHLIF